MVAATAFIIVTVISAFFGYRIYKRERNVFGLRWAVTTILVALCFWMLSKLTFSLYRSIYTPVGDENNYSDQHYEFQFRNLQATLTYIVQYQTRTDVGRDYKIVLKISGVSQAIYNFEIQGPKSTEYRTTDRCSSIPNTSPGNYSCVTPNNDTAEVKWEATPTSTGSSITTIKLPRELKPSSVLGSDWEGGVFQGDQQLVIGCRNGFFYMWVDTERASSVPTSYYDDCDDKMGRKTGPLRITPSNPKFQYRGFSFDISNGEISFSTEIVKTLGVTENTYAILALIGTILASGLGSGWLIQSGAWLLAMIKGKKQVVDPE